MPKVAHGAVPSRRFQRGFSLIPAARATVRLIDGRTGRIRRCRKLASAGHPLFGVRADASCSRERGARRSETELLLRNFGLDR
jgi:hypothetical protein